MKRTLFLPIMLVGLTLSACSDGSWLGDNKEKPPLKGDRISVLDYEQDLRPDKASEEIAPFAASEPWNNDTWPQAGGYPGHAMQNLALSNKALQKVWSVDIGEGSRSNLPLTAQPVIVGKSIFTLDTDSRLSSFSTETGQKRWTINVRDPNEDDPAISGGIAASDGMVYVTAGYDELLCVDAQKGEIKWRAKLSAPSRAAPTVLGSRIFVTTLSNNVQTLDTADGKMLWEFSGIAENTGLIGAASPAATTDLVVPAFSSGEIYALRSTNGSVAWSDNLSNSLRLGGMTALSDIRGLPVIDDNVVYAVSFGGKTAAIDLRTGARIWQKDIGGSKTPWISSNRVFLVSSMGQIVSLDKEKGTIIWVSQLARFKNKKEKTGPIFWTGPLMAGNRLIVVSTDGRVAEVDPAKGTLLREWSNGKDMRISPLIADGTFYILAEDGTLIAYK